ncbi:MAG: hypothetical protein ACXVLQ_13875 [Bacteriovorax sp.]
MKTSKNALLALLVFLIGTMGGTKSLLKLVSKNTSQSTSTGTGISTQSNGHGGSCEC